MRTDVLADWVCSKYDSQAMTGGTRADKVAEANPTFLRLRCSRETSPSKAQLRTARIDIASWGVVSSENWK